MTSHKYHFIKLWNGLITLGSRDLITCDTYIIGPSLDLRVQPVLVLIPEGWVTNLKIRNSFHIQCQSEYQNSPVFKWLQPVLGRFHKRVLHPEPKFRALRPTFEKLFTGTKVWRKARKFGVGCKTVYEIDPWILNGPVLGSHLKNRIKIWVWIKLWPFCRKNI